MVGIGGGKSGWSSGGVVGLGAAWFVGGGELASAVTGRRRWLLAAILARNRGEARARECGDDVSDGAGQGERRERWSSSTAAVFVHLGSAEWHGAPWAAKAPGLRLRPPGGGLEVVEWRGVALGWSGGELQLGAALFIAELRRVMDGVQGRQERC